MGALTCLSYGLLVPEGIAPNAPELSPEIELMCRLAPHWRVGTRIFGKAMRLAMFAEWALGKPLEPYQRTFMNTIERKLQWNT